MLIFNLHRVFALRGIENPAAYMVTAGIGRQTANNLLNRQTSVVKIEHVELLCRLLNCTPNDFFDWHGAENSLSEKHSLNTLRRVGTAQEMANRMRDIPLDKVEELVKDSQSDSN